MEIVIKEKTDQKLIVLAKRLFVDFCAATSAAFLVSPFIAIIDRSVIENASGRNPLVTSIKAGFLSLLKKPHEFIRSRQFLLVYTVYSSTYITVNNVDTLCHHHSLNNQIPKFFGASFANMATCIYKDRQFTRMFGAIAPRSLPIATYGFFAARDSLTMAASFNMPDIMGSRLYENGWVSDRERAMNFAQIASPALAQLVSTPLHLFGLDLYNRRDVTMGGRTKLVMQQYSKSTFARIVRIAPAFGIGGVANRVFRRRIGQFMNVER
ncbi:2497_t:CDS:2 [Ambispora gerdemannii]|uniref:2497_t:CDS:1 n=1 Tax=Ambispora gerdemannii TaxID=144530 RepID=A0A9N9FXH0_9GLOM|nr:2497_t:CDS:2 [Ambispora gerdemannii]